MHVQMESHLANMRKIKISQGRNKHSEENRAERITNKWIWTLKYIINLWIKAFII